MKAILTLFIIVFVNGCIYVFALQEKTNVNPGYLYKKDGKVYLESYADL